MAMNHQQVNAALARMAGESALRERSGELQFDGSEAWQQFTAALAAAALERATALRASGDLGPPALEDQFGTP